MAMTQSVAYKILRKNKMAKPKYREALNHRATMRNLEFAKGAVSDLNGEPSTSSVIWAAARHGDLVDANT
jgi:hypothetical protein